MSSRRWNWKLLLSAIALFLVFAANRIVRTIWLSFRSFNRGWLIGQGLFKAVIIGLVVAIVMFGISAITGQGFSPLTIFEVVLWMLPGWFGAVVARGLLWNTDNLRDANLRAVNQTVADPVDYNDHHHDDGGVPQDDIR